MLKRTVVGTVVALTLLLVAAPASAQYRHERRLTLGAGGTFLLDSDTGSVTVTGDSTADAVVTITSRNADFERRYQIDAAQEGGNVTVRIKRRSGVVSDWFRRTRGENARIVINLPQATSTTISTAGGSIQAARLGNVRLRTSGGGVSVDDVQGQADLRTSGGSIAARNVRGPLEAHTSGGGISVGQIGGSVRADTSGGSISIDGATGDIVASTSGGGVRVRGAGGHVEAHTAGGSVTVEFLPGNGRGGNLSTSGGGIIAAVDPAMPLSIDAAASGGRVTADVPLTVRGAFSRQSIRGDLNGGGPLLRLRTSGGGVRIALSR